MIELIGGRKPGDGDGILASLHRKRLALAELSHLLFMKDCGVAGEDFYVAAIVEIVDPEGAFALGLNGEIATSHAEIVFTRRSHVKGSSPLAKNEASGTGAIVEREIVELENGVGVEESHGAILKFDLGAAVVRGKDVALANREIGLCRLPDGLFIRERVSVSFPSKANVTLDEAEADDAGMAGSCGRRTRGGGESEKKAEGKDVPKRGAVGHVSPPWGIPVDFQI